MHRFVLSVVEQEKIERGFLEIPPHKLPAGAARGIRERIDKRPEAERVDALRSVARSIRSGSSIVAVSVAGVEDLHATHNRRSGHQGQVSSYTTIAADSVSQQLRRVSREFTAAMHSVQPQTEAHETNQPNGIVSAKRSSRHLLGKT